MFSLTILCIGKKAVNKSRIVGWSQTMEIFIHFYRS